MSERFDRLVGWITALRPDWHAADLSACLYLEGGYSNDNYLFTHRGERYVLRAPYRARPYVDRACEQRLYRRLPPGIAPELVAFDPVSGRMISRWVAGTLLADLDPEPETLVRYLADLHSRLPATRRGYDPLELARTHLRDAAACGASAPGWIERLAETPWRPAATVSCHNDLNPWNLIRTPDGRWVTLDWEWFGRNDPLFDLVTLHQSLHFADATLPTLAAELLQSSAAGSGPVSGSRLRACLVALWLREYAWAHAELAAGNERPEIAEQRARGEDRLRALAS